jgi:hypothetical protein
MPPVKSQAKKKTKTEDGENWIVSLVTSCAMAFAKGKEGTMRSLFVIEVAINRSAIVTA